jgi:STE24 endopeptidase
MPTLLVAYVVASCAWFGLSLYLTRRQISHVLRHRGHVPGDFVDRVTLDEHRRAADYTVARAHLSVLRDTVSLALSLALAIWGLDAIAGAFSEVAAPWRDVATVVAALVPSFLIGLPFRLWSDFVVEARFGFNKKTPALFVRDAVTSLVISGVVGVPLLLGLFWAMDHLVGFWWVYAWLALVALMLLAPPVYMNFIAPLFNRFTPLEDGTMRGRIEALMARCGFRSSGLFTMDASKRSSHGNAYFIGFGRTKRIVLFDTLLATQGPREVEAVIAHELGHFKHGHTLQAMVRNVAWMFLIFGAFGWLCRQPWLLPAFGYVNGGHALAFLAASMVLGIITPAMAPLGNWISRRHEFQADDFARRQVGADPMVSALLKLSRDNAGTLTPDPLYAAMTYSHPPVPVRIASLRAATG